jgi:hypothetical protein
MEPCSLHLLGKSSTTELHPQTLTIGFSVTLKLLVYFINDSINSQIKRRLETVEIENPGLQSCPRKREEFWHCLTVCELERAWLDDYMKSSDLSTPDFPWI